MNRVGEHGRGESVWLGWFLYATLVAFAPLAQARGEHGARHGGWRTPPSCASSLEREAWDGEWYGAAIRRRHAARLGRERRVPHRFDRAILERDLRRRGHRSARRRPWQPSTSS